MEKYQTIYRFKEPDGHRELLIEGVPGGVEITIGLSGVLLSYDQWYALRYLPIYPPSKEEPSDES